MDNIKQKNLWLLNLNPLINLGEREWHNVSNPPPLFRFFDSVYTDTDTNNFWRNTLSPYVLIITKFESTWYN